MRATLKSVAATRLKGSSKALAGLTRNTLLTVFLIAFNLVSAFALVYSKDINRRCFMQYQNLQQVHLTQMNGWSKLLLEQSTWAAQSRIQRIATTRLGMVMPNPKDVIIIND